jgi:hypothetical protein
MLAQMASETGNFIKQQADLIRRLKEDAEIWYEHATNPCSDYQTLCDCDRDHRALMKELGEKK